MVLSPGFILRSGCSPEAGRAQCRLKTDTFPLGACRSRLVQALRQLGVVAERLAVEIREEGLPPRLRAERRRARLRADERIRQVLGRSRHRARAAAILRATRLAQTLDEELAPSQAEQRRFALMLQEELASDAMTEAQKAAARLEDQVVAWLGCAE